MNALIAAQTLPVITGLILGLHPANERLRYFVTTSLIGWVQAENQAWITTISGDSPWSGEADPIWSTNCLFAYFILLILLLDFEWKSIISSETQCLATGLHKNSLTFLWT